MKVTYRKVNYHAWVNQTWLQHSAEKIIKCYEYRSGRIDIVLDGRRLIDVGGVTYTSQYNGWNYTLKKLLGRPLKRITN